MASKFQNRLVGTVILVALGVIVLPGLLDGQKKHYEDEFAAIPLVPKPGDTNEPDMLPAATQALPSQPPEGAAAEVRAGTAAAPGLDVATLPGDTGADIDEIPVRRDPPVKIKSPAEKPVEKPQVKVAEKSVSPPVTIEPETQQTVTQQQPVAVDKPEKPVAENKAPVGQAYVVQLGALKNAEKVNEIVTKLRSSGFKVYTSPSPAVQGQVTRILVGPDASKDKLKTSLSKLNQISGLNGVVMNYSAR